MDGKNLGGRRLSRAGEEKKDLAHAARDLTTSARPLADANVAAGRDRGLCACTCVPHAHAHAHREARRVRMLWFCWTAGPDTTVDCRCVTLDMLPFSTRPR